MSKTKYPKVPQSTKRRKSKTEATKYQDIVKSHPVEATHNTKQEKKKSKLKKESRPSINDARVKDIAKKAVKKW